MSDAKRYDRCGIYYTESNGSGNVRHWLDGMFLGSVDLDLCERCYVEFGEWMKGRDSE